LTDAVAVGLFWGCDRQSQASS